jgi:hypothetical protein
MRRLSQTPLIKTFLQEGLFYFLAVSSINVLNVSCDLYPLFLRQAFLTTLHI